MTCTQIFKYHPISYTGMAQLDHADFELLKDKGDLCKECLNFKDFGEKCWYFWNEKKDCSQKLR